MHRLTRVLDDSTPDVNDFSGVQSRIRVFLLSEAATFATNVQISAKASVDESLQAAESLACIGGSGLSAPPAGATMEGQR